MKDLSRRHFFGLGTSGIATLACGHTLNPTPLLPPNPFASMTTERERSHCRRLLFAATVQTLGEIQAAAWFTGLDVEHYVQGVLTTSVPVKFVRNWINTHFIDHLTLAARSVHPDIQRVDVAWCAAWSEHPRNLSFNDTPPTRGPNDKKAFAELMAEARRLPRRS